MILNGRALAREILARTKARTEKLSRPPRIVAFVTADETPATRSYLKIKARSAADAGCDFEVITDARLFLDADAVIIQLPLPPSIDMKVMCDTIPIEKDADVLSTTARVAFERGDEGALLPPVVAAISEIFRVENVEVKGKQAVVIGAGYLVGAPVATWFTQQGAKVTIVNQSTENFLEILRGADILVSGAGSSHFIIPDMLKQSVVLIDAGTSESGGTLAGDADPACADKCSVFTPVPGGVGPIAVACLFENVVTLAERAMNI